MIEFLFYIISFYCVKQTFEVKSYNIFHIMNELPNIDVRPPIQKTQSKMQSFWKELLKFAIIAIFVVLPIRYFIAQPFIVKGASMDPTFETGQYLIIDEISYRFEEPKRGEVIVFRYPLDQSRYFIKRIIGLPEETLELRGGEIIIKNSESPDGFLLEEPYLDANLKKTDNLSVTLSKNQYFVMGDNRLASLDSRIWGPLSKDLIIGKPFIRLLPITKINLFPGQ